MTQPVEMRSIAPPAEPAWTFVLVMGALMALASISTDLYLPAIPAMSRAFHASPAEVQQTLAAFMLGMSVSQLFYGPLSDRVGRRPALLLGITIYLLGTMACGLAASVRMLATARFVQALGACSLHVVPRALIRDKFEFRISAQVFSRLTVATGVAPMLGPLLGGYLVSVSEWQSVFLVPAIWALLIGSWIFFRVDETLARERMLRARHEPALRSIAGLFTQRSLMGFVLCSGFNAAVFFAYLVCAPGLIMGTYHVPPERFGWVFACNACGFIAVNQLNARLLRSYSPLTVLRASRLPTIGLGVVLLVDAYTGAFGKWGVLVPLFFALSSGGLIGPNATACALHIDPGRAGSISSLIGTLSFLLGALASWLAGRLQDDTAVPMASLMLACLLASAFALFVIARGGHDEIKEAHP